MLYIVVGTGDLVVSRIEKWFRFVGFMLLGEKMSSNFNYEDRGCWKRIKSKERG